MSDVVHLLVGSLPSKDRADREGYVAGCGECRPLRRGLWVEGRPWASGWAGEVTCEPCQARSRT